MDRSDAPPTSCAGPQLIPVTAVPWLTRQSFGRLPDGRPVDMYVLNSRTVEMTCITYGGIIVSLRVPDRHGRWSDVVLGYPALEPYLTNDSYLGAVIGRYANRIAGGRFVLGGVSYQLATNDGANHLHGGVRGFDQHLWTAAVVEAPGAVGVALSRTSPAGEEHYPGCAVGRGHVPADIGQYPPDPL